MLLYACCSFYCSISFFSFRVFYSFIIILYLHFVANKRVHNNNKTFITKMRKIKASMRNGDGGVCNAVQRDNDQLAADVVVPAYLCQSNSNHRRRPPQCRGGVVSGAFEQRPVDRHFTADAAAQVVGVAGGRWPYRLRSSSRTITASSATSRSRRGRGRSIC